MFDHQTNKVTDRLFTEQDLAEMRAEMYAYCRDELHFPDEKAREWAERSVAALEPSLSSEQKRPATMAR